MRVSWDSWARAERARIVAADRWRTIRELDSGGPVARLDGCEVVSFASNDYFGLSQHPAVRAAAHEAIERWGTGAGSARLIAGSRPVHSELERELADWKGADRTLLFPTGFAANLGVLSVVGGPDVTIISDQLNHASIIDGCRLARGEVRIYRHGDLGQVAGLLRDADRAVVVTDSVFSMDGDVAPLAELARLCAARDALLVIDDAHAALGPEPPRAGGPVLRVGTLSKMLGSAGGFVAGPGPLVDLIINRARSFIFTTAPAPAAAAAALAALRVLRSGKGTRSGEARRADRPGAAGSPVPDHPGGARRRVRRCGCLAGAPGPGSAGARDPAADRAARHLPPARGAVGRPQRRADQPAPDRPGRGCPGLSGWPSSAARPPTWARRGHLRLASQPAPAWRSGRRAQAAQSFARDGRPTDAELLAAASGQAPWDVCPAHRWYPAAMAPPMAAEARAGRPSPAPTSPPSRTGLPGRRSGSSKRRAAFALRWHPTATR